MTTITKTNLSSNTEWGALSFSANKTGTTNGDTYLCTTSTGHTWHVNSLQASRVTAQWMWIFPEEVTLTENNVTYSTTGKSSDCTVTLTLYDNDNNVVSNTSGSKVKTLTLQESARMASPNMNYVLKSLAVTYEEDTPEPPVDTDSDSDVDTDVDSDVDSDIDTDQDTDTDTDTDVDSDSDTDSDTDDDPPEPEPLIDIFTLPYYNWYDDLGRIYKDRLIANFNAIERKINELASIDISSITLPDLDNTTYPTVDLDDVGVDDNILSFGNFIQLCDIVNYPLVVDTDGNNTVKRVEYWGDDFVYHTVTNSTVYATEDYPYIYLDINDQKIKRSDSTTFLEGYSNVLLAVLVNNKLVTNSSPIPGNINFQKVMSDQAKKYIESKGSSYNTSGAKNYRYIYNSQNVIASAGETGSSVPYTGGILSFGLENATRTEKLTKKEDTE